MNNINSIQYCTCAIQYRYCTAAIINYCTVTGIALYGCNHELIQDPSLRLWDFPYFHVNIVHVRTCPDM